MVTIRAWEANNGTIRYYINDWASLIGIEYGTHKSGNISWAEMNGEKLANDRTRRIISNKIWVDGNLGVHLDRFDGAQRIDEETVRQAIEQYVSQNQSLFGAM